MLNLTIRGKGTSGIAQWDRKNPIKRDRRVLDFGTARWVWRQGPMQLRTRQSRYQSTTSSRCYTAVSEMFESLLQIRGVV